MYLIDKVADDSYKIGESLNGGKALTRTYANKLALFNPSRFRLFDKDAENAPRQVDNGKSDVERLMEELAKVRTENDEFKALIKQVLETQKPVEALTSSFAKGQPASTTASNSILSAAKNTGEGTGEAGEGTGEGDKTPPADEIDATDAAIQLAKDNQIDLATVTPTGKTGGITKPDVEKAIEEAEKAKTSRRPNTGDNPE